MEKKVSSNKGVIGKYLSDFFGKNLLHQDYITDTQELLKELSLLFRRSEEEKIPIRN